MLVWFIIQLFILRRINIITVIDKNKNKYNNKRNNEKLTNNLKKNKINKNDREK